MIEAAYLEIETYFLFLVAITVSLAFPVGIFFTFHFGKSSYGIIFARYLSVNLMTLSFNLISLTVNKENNICTNAIFNLQNLFGFVAGVSKTGVDGPCPVL